MGKVFTEAMKANQVEFPASKSVYLGIFDTK